MKTLEQRRADYEKVSKKIKELGDEVVAEMLKNATQIHSGIGGTAVKLEIEGVPIFAKQIALTDLEMANPESTKNLFNLPTYYQYGVGSAGFGAWRELAAHKITTDWVLNNECPNFPVMYGSKILPKEKAPPMNHKEEELFDGQIKYWGNSAEIRNRNAEIRNSTNSLVVLMESIPQTLASYIHPQASNGNTKSPDMEMVQRDLKSTCAFMESKSMIHFDAHGGNILTDGERLYFADFGLATSLDFDLSKAEKEFFEKNRGYDRSLATACLCWHPCAESGEPLPILPEVAKVSNRYQSVSQRYSLFTGSLRDDLTKTTAYPMEEMQKLHQEVDSPEKEKAKKSFVERVSQEKPNEKDNNGRI